MTKGPWLDREEVWLLLRSSCVTLELWERPAAGAGERIFTQDTDASARGAKLCYRHREVEPIEVPVEFLFDFLSTLELNSRL